VQTGFSDAGRYLGQIAAAASIERFRVRLADVLARHGLKGIDIVVFDTHGESIGRGAHPGGFAERLAYTNPPASRRRFDRAGVNLIEEVSFQGGDGYLYYFNEAGAFAAVTRILEHALTPPPMANDPFYEDPDFIREAFTEITQFQVALMRDPDYGALLGAIMTYLLYPSGSRPNIREHEGIDFRPIAFAAELRAIPHNATLLQLGFAANVLGGLGAAVSRDPERFEAIYNRSPRLKSLMGMAEYALHIGDFDTMRAYVATLDPGLWLARAEETTDRIRAARMREVADLLERADLHDRQNRVLRRLHRDYLSLVDGVSELSGFGERFRDPAHRTSLALVHAIRVALIHEIFMLAGNVPDFAPQYGTTRERVMMQLLHLDVPGAVAALERIFPADDSVRPAKEDFGEPASYRTDEDQTYATEHASLLRPLRGLHALCRRASEAVVHHIGFFG
jgi:phosphoenolpyruvate carboxylase